MRQLKDARGSIVYPERVSGTDAYAGMIEGTPYLARKFRLLQGRAAMKSPGVFVFGLDELEHEIAQISRDIKDWAPNESWESRLVSEVDWENFRRRYLIVRWYQEGGDPMEKLARLVATLDFAAYSQEEEVERDP